MKRCECGNPVAGNAIFCPHCGKRFTRRSVKVLAVCFGLFLGIPIIAATIQLIHEQDTGAVAKARFDPVETSIGGCKQWTRSNSKLAVDNFVNSYQIKRARLPKGVYKVGVDYRAKGAGLMMHSECEYRDAGDRNHMVLVKAWSSAE